MADASAEGAARKRISPPFRRPQLAKNGKLYPRHQCRACENAAWRRAWVAGKKGRLSATVLAVNAPPASVPSLSNGEWIEAKLEDAILQRMRLYQSDALDALHDLAIMPISENAMQNHDSPAGSQNLGVAMSAMA